MLLTPVFVEQQHSYLPTPLAAFKPPELPDREEEELLLPPVPMDQSLSPEVRDEV